MLTEIQLFVIATVAAAIVWTLKLAKVQLAAGWLTTLIYNALLKAVLEKYIKPLLFKSHG